MRSRRKRRPVLPALVAAALALSGLTLLLRRRPVHTPHVAPPDEAPWQTLFETERVLPPARHERTDVSLWWLLLGGAGTLALLAGTLGLSLWLYPGATTDKRIQLPMPQFPDPPLQPNPQADMAVFRTQQLQQLNTAYWLDRDRRVVHLPIGQAMQDIARRGIPDWPTAPVRGPIPVPLGAASVTPAAAR